MSPHQIHTKISSAKLTNSNNNNLIIIKMFLWPLISGVLFTNAQYSSSFGGGGNSAALVVTAPCDFERLRRCQQDTLRDMQLVTPTSGSLESTDVQYSISSGPPYSPIQQAKQLIAQRQLATANQSTCRLVRANLDCLITTTPACYDAGIQAAQNTDIILRAKRFLEQNGCNGVDQTWQGTFCYRAPEVHVCEERYGLTSPYSTTTSHRNLTACLAYNAFRYCLSSHLRLNCKVHEIDMLNEYLIDHAGDLAWRCPLNVTTTTTTTSGSLQALTNPNPYALSDSLAPLSPSSYSGGGGSSYGGSSYAEQRPAYIGQPAGVSLFSPSHSVSRDQPWERFRNQLLVDDTTGQRYGISRQPGEVFGKFSIRSSGGRH